MLKSSLSYLANKFQAYLFPIVEDHLYEDELFEKHRKLIKILEIIQIEHYIDSKIPGTKGRPPKHTVNVARAFIAKHVLNLKTTSQLIYHLKLDKNLRYICGWEPGQRIADESTFSRIFRDLAQTNILDRIHEDLAIETFQGHVVLHNARDSVPIPVREWPRGENNKKFRYSRNKKKKRKPRAKVSVCQQQNSGNLSLEEMLESLPQKCNIGRKANSSGKLFCWRGYKLHVDIAEGWFPLSCIMTSASTHDTQAAIPLSKMSSNKASVLYELMDSAYNSREIVDYITRHNRRPLIVPRIWKGKKEKEKKRELESQKNISWHTPEAKRLQSRFSNERIFARLKDNFSGLDIWVRGYEKVKFHVMLSVLCIAADELLRFVC